MIGGPAPAALLYLSALFDTIGVREAAENYQFRIIA